MTVSAPVANRLFVGNFFNGSIRAFDAGATGDAAPVRSIVGAATGMLNARQLALSGTDLFVANRSNGPAVRVFDVSANGDVAPLRTLSGGNTGFSVSGGSGGDR